MKTIALDRSAPPPPGEMEPFRFPGFVHRRLPSGMEAYVARIAGRPLLSVELLAPAGAQYDAPGRAGLATLTGSLLDEGAAGESSMAIAERIESLGGQLITGADWDVGFASLMVLSRHADAGLRLLAEVMATPSFPPAEVERVRGLRLTDLMRRRHQPAALADQELAAAVYQGTVYANPSSGTEATVAAIDRGEIVDFYRDRYRLPATTLIAVSDLDPEELLDRADRALRAAAPEAFAGGAAGPFAAAAGDRGDLPKIEPLPLPGVRVHIVDRPGAAQTELRLGHASVPRAHPDRSAIVFLNALLGGKFTSRINLNLRERHGYTYSASSSVASRLGPGPFTISTAVGTEVAGAAAREVLAELRRIQAEPVSVEEMEETRSYIIGVFPYTVQSVTDLGRRLADLATFGLPDGHFDRNLEKVAALTRADIQRAAQTHLDPDHLAIVAVGPADLLRPQLEPLGETVVRALDEPANGS
jgi:zinc protease